MVQYSTVILQFDEQGEKTGWTYIEVPADVAQQLKPGNKKSFRVKGTLDNFPISGMALMPMGEGVFIMALKAEIRKGIRKSRGAMLQVALEIHNDFEIRMPDDLHECLNDEDGAMEQFMSQAKSHQNYYINWINSAKTLETRAKRIANTVNAMLQKINYGQMIRALKNEKE
jgi:hypothetical protein